MKKDKSLIPVVLPSLIPATAAGVGYWALQGWALALLPWPWALRLGTVLGWILIGGPLVIGVLIMSCIGVAYYLDKRDADKWMERNRR